MSVSMSLPLDSDGFARRECPTCEQQFKWHFDEEGTDAEPRHQYFCPLCGAPADTDAWWTQDQLDHMHALVMPEAMREIQDSLDSAFRGTKGVKFKRGSNADLPTPEPLHEPDDMRIIEPPCHPSEPLKVPDSAASPFYCLLCGSAFAV